MQLTDATLETRASAARRIVHRTDDRYLLLSYVLWPDDYTFGEVCRILQLVYTREREKEPVAG
jgi:hypothetical protein